MKQLKTIIKTILYIFLNILFSFVIYFISLRPLSPSKEQLIINFKDKTFLAFTLDCLVFAIVLTFVFSTFSYILYRFFLKKTNNLRWSLLIILIIYFMISSFCSLEYYNYISEIIYNK